MGLTLNLQDAKQVRANYYELADLLLESRRPRAALFLVHAAALLPAGTLAKRFCEAYYDHDLTSPAGADRFAGALGHELKEPTSPKLALPPEEVQQRRRGALRRLAQEHKKALEDWQHGSLFALANPGRTSWPWYLYALVRFDRCREASPEGTADCLRALAPFYKQYKDLIRPLEEELVVKAQKWLPWKLADSNDGVRPCRRGG